jgi:hypothetical protein
MKAKIMAGCGSGTRDFGAEVDVVLFFERNT